MVKSVFLCAAATLGLALSPALGITFSENFEAGWPGAAWTVEGVVNPGLGIVQLPAGDSRIQDNAARTAGGFWYERGVSGDGSTWVGGDNEEVWLDYHMPVPNGTYTFQVDLDVQMYWSNVLQPYSQGYAMYIGDAADMAYGTMFPNTNPTGPWQGVTHDVPIALHSALVGTQWNGGGTDGINNGEWKSWSFTQMGGTSVDTIDVTSGEVIFRFTIQLKDKNQNSPDFRTYALDNLAITLVPEPATLGLLAMGGLGLLRRRMR